MDDRHQSHVGIGAHGYGPHQVRRELGRQEDGRRPVGSADDGDARRLVRLETQGQGYHVGPEDTELGGSTDQQKLRVGYQRREIRHGTDTEEYQRRIPSGLHPLIKNVQHGIILIQPDFKPDGFKRNISQDNTQTDRNQKQRLEILLDGQPQEERTHQYHDPIPQLGICKARIGEEVG